MNQKAGGRRRAGEAQVTLPVLSRPAGRRRLCAGLRACAFQTMVPSPWVTWPQVGHHAARLLGTSLNLKLSSFKKRYYFIPREIGPYEGVNMKFPLIFQLKGKMKEN